MAPTASGSSPDVLWSIDRNAATKALAGVTLGCRDTLVNLLCRDINETASCFGHACNVTTNRTANMSCDRPHASAGDRKQILVIANTSLGFLSSERNEQR